MDVQILGLPVRYVDRLGYSIYNSATSNTIKILIWYWDEKSDSMAVVPYDITPTTGRAENVGSIQLPNGDLIGVQVYSNIAQYGQCFVSLSVRRGAGVSIPLLQGYATKIGNLFWTSRAGGMYEQALKQEGKGHKQNKVGTDPAAGAEILETVPTNAVWLLKGINFKFISDANVANRTIHLRVERGGVVDAPLVFWYESTAITANVTGKFLFFSKGTQYNVVAYGYYVNMFPKVWLFETDTVETITTNIQVGDDYSNVTLLLEEFLID